MAIQKGGKSTIITTFGGDIYIIKGKSPDEVFTSIGSLDMIRMPNGAHISRKGFASVQEYEDYEFQTEQKMRHKKGQYLRRGEWHDHQNGSLGINAHLERITGELNIALPSGEKKITGKK